MQQLFLEVLRNFPQVERWTRTSERRMPERDFEAGVGDDNGHSWVQCDACNKWRAVTQSTLAQIQVGFPLMPNPMPSTVL